ncbi:MAG: hypothetical protein H6534_05125 [Chthonomonadaceae bacterium]|nr:hypothetical protein [Chthonomonadaceae bacterium]
MPDDTRWLQSYSGVRAHVGLGPAIEPQDDAFAFRHAYCYALSRLQANPAPRARLLLARDPRPTGIALARAQANGLASACRDLGVELDLVDLGIVSTPVWQHAVRHFEAHGGVMVTASHNPLVDNGWKYATGLETHALDPAPAGALLSAAEMGNLIRAANAFAPTPWRSPLAPVPDEARREEAVAQYVQFVADAYFADAPGAKVLLDPNGGAACGIGERAFRALGIEPIVVNGDVGHPAHPVDVEQRLPDGAHVLDSLAQRVRAEDALFGLAYDFDADRGNLTFVDGEGNVQIPSPQAAAAINTAIALAVHRRSGEARPAAVVASDATSLRVHQIARAFGAEVVEVETGEINVVTMMQELEARGSRAVVGVEGPNGGTVFAGTTCRDGTLVGAGALLAAADADLRARIAEVLAPGAAMAPGLAGFIACLPPQRSFVERRTGAPPWERVVEILDQRFPEAFAKALAGEWETWEIVYSRQRTVSPERPLAGSYGWKARVSRPGAEGFLWVRGSKTEAGVLRVLGDGPNETEAKRLLDLGSNLLG